MLLFEKEKERKRKWTFAKVDFLIFVWHISLTARSAAFLAEFESSISWVVECLKMFSTVARRSLNANFGRRFMSGHQSPEEAKKEVELWTKLTFGKLNNYLILLGASWRILLFYLARADYLAQYIELFILSKLSICCSLWITFLYLLFSSLFRYGCFVVRFWNLQFHGSFSWSCSHRPSLHAHPQQTLSLEVLWLQLVRFGMLQSVPRTGKGDERWSRGASLNSLSTVAYIRSTFTVYWCMSKNIKSH